jgi:inhibitor of cysteine peptidase
MVITENDHGKVLCLRANEVLVIELSENPTTGFRWQLEPEEGVRVESSYSPEDRGASPGVAGGGGKRRFTLSFQNTGQINLRAKLWRAWAGDSSILRSFEVGLHVG